MTFRELLGRLDYGLTQLTQEQQALVAGRLDTSVTLGATLEDADPTLACVLYHIRAGTNPVAVFVSMGLLDE